MRICNTPAFIDFSYTLTHNYLQIMTEKKNVATHVIKSNEVCGKTMVMTFLLKGLVHDNAHARRLSLQNNLLGQH